MLAILLALSLSTNAEALRHIRDASEALRLEMPDLALEHARAALELDPGLPEAHLAAAAALAQTGRLDEALAEYAAAGEPKEGTGAAVAARLATALLEEGRDLEAMRLASSALEGAPEQVRPDMLALLAQASARLGYAEAALQSAQEFLLLAGPEEGWRVFDAVGRTLAARGIPSAACRAWARAVALSPEGSARRRAALMWMEAAYAARDPEEAELALAALLASQPTPEEEEYGRYTVAALHGMRGRVAPMMKHLAHTSLWPQALLLLGAGTLAVAAVPAAVAVVLGRMRRRAPELASALAATALVLLIMTAIPYAVFVMNLPSLEGTEEAGVAGLAPSVAGQMSANLLAVAAALALERRRGVAVPLGLRIVEAPRLFWTAAVAATACFSMLYLYHQGYTALTGAPPPASPLVEALREASRPALIAWIGMFVTVGAPLTEELIYRGLIYARFRAALGPVAALAISSLLFGAAHAQPALLAPAMIVGAVMGILYEATGSVLPPILAHCAFNTVSLSVALLSG